MSFSIDMTSLLENATLIVNSLWPVVAIGVGFALGFSILAMIGKSLSRIGRG